MNYQGTIIEESLQDAQVLQDLKILSTKIESITDRHQTPWLRQWTLYKVEIPEDQVEEVSEQISHTLDYQHGSSWYVDYKNDQFHYIIFKDKVFKVDLANPVLHKTAREYGLGLGIPEYQMKFGL